MQQPGRFGGIFDSDGVSAESGSSTALDCAPFFFTHSAPDTSVLTGIESPMEALIDHRTAPAHRFRLLNLQKGGTGSSNREEQLRVFVAAGGTVAPVRHGGNTPCFLRIGGSDRFDHSYMHLAVSISPHWLSD
jgi:hypothetical protein